MIENLAALFDVSQSFLALGFLVFLRLAPIVGFMPGFGEAVVPVRVKLVLAICFTLACLPIADTSSDLEVTYSIGLPLLFGETIVGLILGVVLRFFVIALQTAGSMAAQATSLAQLFAGASTEPMPAIGHLFVVSGLALAMLMGLPIRVIELVVLSYEALPIGVPPTAYLFTQWGAELVARTFTLAFSMAAPFVAMSLLYNLTLGVINRAMPQLMVAFVGAPVITAGGLVFLLLFGPLLLSLWWAEFAAFLSAPGVLTR